MDKKKLKKFSAGSSETPDAFEEKSGYQDPWIFRFNKEMKKGEAVVFRFLNNDPDFNPVTEMVCASVLDTKNNRMMDSVPVPRPDLDLLGDDDILDDDGNSLRDLMDINKNYRTVQRTPVWLMYKLDKNRKVIEEYGKLVYIEVNYALGKSYIAMKTDVDAESEFEGSMPPYAVMITKEDGNSAEFTRYDFKPCKKLKIGGKTVEEETLGIVKADEALGDEIWNEIMDQIDDLMEFLYDLAEDEVKPENVKKRFARYRSATNSKGGNSEVSSMDDESEDEYEEAEAEANKDEDEKPQRSRRGRQWNK